MPIIKNRKLKFVLFSVSFIFKTVAGPVTIVYKAPVMISNLDFVSSLPCSKT